MRGSHGKSFSWEEKKGEIFFDINLRSSRSLSAKRGGRSYGNSGGQDFFFSGGGSSRRDIGNTESGEERKGLHKSSSTSKNW